MTILLALDSSTEMMALALSSPAGTQVVEAAGGPQASARLVPEALALLARAGLALADVDAIAFGRGPGAFTGLRTACAVVQGLAFGAGKPVLSIDSLMLVAEDARRQAIAAGAPFAAGQLVWVAIDARMGEIYAGAYRLDADGWHMVDAPALYAPVALLAHWGAPAVVAGSALEVLGAQLGVVERGFARCATRAEALAALAAQAFARGELLDAAEAMPVYVRDKVAQTTEERLALKATAG